MEGLIASMTRENPAARPSIEDVLWEFSCIQASLSKGTLSSAITSKNASKVVGVIRQARQSVRTSTNVIQTALPTSSPPTALRPQSAPVPNLNERQGGTRQRGTLVKSELWWRDHYYDILDRGYKLRPRYHPQWEPSWIRSKKDFFSVEDGQATIVSRIVLYADSRTQLNRSQ